MSSFSRPLRGIGGGFAAVAIAAGAICAMPLTASASAHGCASGGKVDSCITVNGQSTFVETVDTSANISGHTAVLGHFHVYGGGLEFNSSDQHYYNDGFFAKEVPGPTYRVDRSLPDGAQVCVSFVEKDTAGQHVYPPACETIHR